jgi:D-sedoheptulose 7-phosphate isomerase
MLSMPIGVGSMGNQAIINSRFRELQEVLESTANLSAFQIEKAALVVLEAFTQGNKLLICGNGGSAADSQHFAAELISSFTHGLDRKSLPAIALTTDTSVMTAYGNDFDFDGIYERQIEGLGKKNDVLCVISTSGKSKNCLRAAKTAQKLGLKVIALTKVKSDISKFADYTVEVSSENTQHIQETHIAVIHIMVEIIEASILEMGN